MDPFYLLMHGHDTGRVKVVGIYSSRELAEEAEQRVRTLPGFAEEPGGFTIEQYEIDKDHWSRGFVRL